MLRLLTGNDWFGDNQIREVILDEFNEMERTMVEGRFAVLDKPFNTLLERVNKDEPFAHIIRYEKEQFINAMNGILPRKPPSLPQQEYFDPLCQNRSQVSGQTLTEKRS
jgi:hypothetical protein